MVVGFAASVEDWDEAFVPAGVGGHGGNVLHQACLYVVVGGEMIELLPVGFTDATEESDVGVAFEEFFEGEAFACEGRFEARSFEYDADVDLVFGEVVGSGGELLDDVVECFA